MRNVQCSESPTDTKSDRDKSLTTPVSQYVPSFLDLQKLFNWLHKEHEKL